MLGSFGVAPCMREETPCTFGAADGAKSAVLIGDSYAQHYAAAIDKTARGLDVRWSECRSFNPIQASGQSLRQRFA